LISLSGRKPDRLLEVFFSIDINILPDRIEASFRDRSDLNGQTQVAKRFQAGRKR